MESSDRDVGLDVAESSERRAGRHRNDIHSTEFVLTLGNLFLDHAEAHTFVLHQSAPAIPDDVEVSLDGFGFGLRVLVVRHRAPRFAHLLRLGHLGDDFLLVVFAAFIGLAALVAGILGILATLLVLCHAVLLQRKVKWNYVFDSSRYL